MIKKSKILIFVLTLILLIGSAFPCFAVDDFQRVIPVDGGYDVLLSDGTYERFNRPSTHSGRYTQNFAFDINVNYDLYQVFEVDTQYRLSLGGMNSVLPISVDGSEYHYIGSVEPGYHTLVIKLPASVSVRNSLSFTSDGTYHYFTITRTVVSDSDPLDPLLGMNIVGTIPVGYGVYIQNAHAPISLTTTTPKRVSQALAPTYRYAFDIPSISNAYSVKSFTGANKNLFGNSSEWEDRLLYSEANDIIIFNPAVTLQMENNGGYRGVGQNTITYSVPYNPSLIIRRFPLTTVIDGSFNSPLTVNMSFTSDSAIEAGVPDSEGIVEYYVMENDHVTTQVAITKPNGNNNADVGVDDELYTSFNSGFSGLVGASSGYAHGLIESTSGLLQQISQLFAWLPSEFIALIASFFAIVLVVGVIKLFM